MNPPTLTHRSFLHAVFALALVAAPLCAGEAKYLSAGQPDALQLLAPPAAADTPEGRAELEATFAVHTSAAPELVARAADENKLTIFHFAPAIGAWFVSGKFPKTEALFKEVEAEAKAMTDDAKNQFKQPRPYHIAPQRFPHSIEHEDPTHYSYPSGHSTRGTVFAALLAEIFPEKRVALLEKGRETGWLRVIGGVHYPSDVFAGRVLGQALAKEFLRNEKFQTDLAAARAELVSARGAGSDLQ
jgi:acid phosphatase (class A)